MVEYEQCDDTQDQNKQERKKNATVENTNKQSALNKNQQWLSVLQLLLHTVAVVSRPSEAEEDCQWFVFLLETPAGHLCVFLLLIHICCLVCCRCFVSCCFKPGGRRKSTGAHVLNHNFCQILSTVPSFYRSVSGPEVRRRNERRKVSHRHTSSDRLKTSR